MSSASGRSVGGSAPRKAQVRSRLPSAGIGGVGTGRSVAGRLSVVSSRAFDAGELGADFAELANDRFEEFRRALVVISQALQAFRKFEDLSDGAVGRERPGGVDDFAQAHALEHHFHAGGSAPDLHSRYQFALQ